MARGRDCDWPFPDKIRLPWRVCSLSVRVATQLIAKTFLRVSQQVQTKNIGVLHRAICERPKGIPVVTVSNHTSVIDDPGVWGLLPLKTSLFSNSYRWVPSAKEICFKNKLSAFFFAQEQGVPVIRGDGVYQRGMNFCINLLNEGNWVHVFPEGKVNLTGECLRMKWGIGRLIAEAKITPLVVPLWHIGMNDILPNKTPYFPRIFKKLTVLVGEPIDFSSLLRHRRAEMCASAVIIRKQITDTIQEKLIELRTHTQLLHNSWNTNLPIAFRRL